jgi:hypothetical protein
MSLMAQQARFWSVVGAILIVVGGRAFAADLRQMVPVAPAAVDWAGFHFGGSVGGRWADNEWTTTAVAPAQGGRPDWSAHQHLASAAVRLGGFFGYNWMLRQSWIIGLEADLGWANNKAHRTPIPGTPLYSPRSLWMAAETRCRSARAGMPAFERVPGFYCDHHLTVWERRNCRVKDRVGRKLLRK